MNALSNALAGLLSGLALALLAAAMGVPWRAGRQVALSAGAWAMIGAVAAARLASSTGFGALANAAVCVPLAFVAGYAFDALTTAPELPWRRRGGRVGAPGDAVSQTVLEAAFVVGAVAFVTGSRGADAVGGTAGQETISLFGGPVLARPQVAAAAVCAVGLALLAWFVARSRTALRLGATASRPHIVALGGVDGRQARAATAGLTAAAAALAGICYSQGHLVAPADGIALTIAGVEAAVIGGLGSLPGAVVGGLVVGLARAGGDELAQGWGPLVGHLVALVAVALRTSTRARRWANPVEREAV